MVIISKKEIEQLKSSIQVCEDFIKHNTDTVVKYFLSTFYDDYAIVIYEHIKQADMGDKFDEKTLRKELDIPNDVFSDYKLILSKNNIIFQTNRILKVLEYRNSYIWCLNNEKTCLSLFYRFYKIHEKYLLPTKNETEAQYYCPNSKCIEYNNMKRLLDILCNINSENTTFKCQLCSQLLKQKNDKNTDSLNSKEKDTLAELNTFKQETQVIYNLLYQLILRFQDLYKLKNSLEKAKYELEIEKIENYGKHIHNDDYYTINTNTSDSIDYKKDLTSIFSEAKKAKVEKIGEYIYIKNIGKEVDIHTIKDIEIDKMNDEEYEKYCALLKNSS